MWQAEVGARCCILGCVALGHLHSLERHCHPILAVHARQQVVMGEGQMGCQRHKKENTGSVRDCCSCRAQVVACQSGASVTVSYSRQQSRTLCGTYGTGMQSLAMLAIDGNHFMSGRCSYRGQSDSQSGCPTNTPAPCGTISDTARLLPPSARP